jgi:hypothetical protein
VSWPAIVVKVLKYVLPNILAIWLFFTLVMQNMVSLIELTAYINTDGVGATNMGGNCSETDHIYQYTMWIWNDYLRNWEIRGGVNKNIKYLSPKIPRSNGEWYNIVDSCDTFTRTQGAYPSVVLICDWISSLKIRSHNQHIATLVGLPLLRTASVPHGSIFSNGRLALRQPTTVVHRH